MDPSRKKSLKRLCLLLMFLPGLVMWGAYEFLLWLRPEWAFGLYAKREAIAGLLATFGFTMTGFLAAVITLMFNHYNSIAFFQYRKEGYFEIFLFEYYCAILFLLVTCLLALLCYSGNPLSSILFLCLLVNFCNNIAHIGIITYIICHLAQMAAKETE